MELLCLWPNRWGGRWGGCCKQEHDNEKATQWQLKCVFQWCSTSDVVPETSPCNVLSIFNKYYCCITVTLYCTWFCALDESLACLCFLANNLGLVSMCVRAAVYVNQFNMKHWKSRMSRIKTRTHPTDNKLQSIKNPIRSCNQTHGGFLIYLHWQGSQNYIQMSNNLNITTTYRREASGPFVWRYFGDSLASEHFSKDAARAPYVHGCSITGLKQNFRGSVPQCHHLIQYGSRKQRNFRVRC